MKKWIPFISPIAYGGLGGLFLVSGLYGLSMMTSPFADLEKGSFLFVCLLSAILSALLLLVIITVNAVYFMNWENKQKATVVILAESCATILLLLLSWKLWEPIVRELYVLL